MGAGTAALGLAMIGGGGYCTWYFDPKAPVDPKRMPNKSLYSLSIFFIIVGIIIFILEAIKMLDKKTDAANGTPTNVKVPASGTNAGGVNPQGVPQQS